jgi:hypothetical protein
LLITSPTPTPIRPAPRSFPDWTRVMRGRAVRRVCERTDHDYLLQPDLVPDHLHDLEEREGVAGVTGEHTDRDRAALRLGEQPVLDCSLPFVPSRGASGQHRHSSHELDKSNSAIRAGFAFGARWRRAGSASITPCLRGRPPRPVSVRERTMSATGGE